MEWKKNLINYQAEPPLKAWENIAKALAEDAPSTLREELYQLEATPPSSAWDAVVKKLDAPVSVPAKLRKIWYRNPWNVAAAAALAAVIFGIGYSNNKSSTAAGLSTSVVSPAAAEKDPALTVKENIPVADADPVLSAMKNKDNNYLYFISKTGEARRLSYKLQHLFPAIRENKPHKTINAWADKLEYSSATAGGGFFDIVEMVKSMEQQKN